MTAPDKRRPLPALVAIAALTLLTALVWFRVLHRGAQSEHTTQPTKSTCPTPTVTVPTVLPKPGSVTLIVLNSTTRNGLAGNVRKVLIVDGFKVPAQAVNDGTAYGGHGLIAGVGEIRFGPTERTSAALLAFYVPGAKLVQTDSSAPSVILSLGTQFKALATAKAAAAAIAAAHATPSSPTPTPTQSSGC